MRVASWPALRDGFQWTRSREFIFPGESEDTDLPQEADPIVEEILLDDLAVHPSRDGAELELEGLSGRLVHLAIEDGPRANHLPFPPGDRAGPVAGPEHHSVRVVIEVVLD